MAVALVTGAARGIGRAIACGLFDAGFKVALADIEPIAPLDGDPARWMTLSLDIADLPAHQQSVDGVEATLGPIDCLVNNAGVTSLVRGDMLDLTPESFDRSVGINLRGTFFLTQTIAKRMIRAEKAAWRSIITISSANADIVGENRADYCMSKSALTMMNKLFATRLGPAEIGVYEIRPGIIHTDMTKPATEKYDRLVEAGGVPMGRWGEPEDIAQSVVALAQGSFRYATGIAIDLGGGMQLYRI